MCNNGDIAYIADNRNLGWTQSFTYDGLNRLTSAFRSDGGYNHTYNYDSFGNLLIQDNINPGPTYNINSATNQLNRLVNNVNIYNYDNAGNLLSSGTGDIGGHSFTYNALNQITTVDGGATAAYTYNGSDQRAMKATPGAVTSYAYFNGQIMAEQNQSASGPTSWTDYIYASGQKIAKVDSSEPALHVSAYRSPGNLGCGAEWSFSNGAGTPIAAGDRLAVDILQTNYGGGVALVLQDGEGTGYMPDINTGDYLWLSTQGGAWHHFVGDLTPWANQTVAYALIGMQQPTPEGQNDLWAKSMVIVHANGSITPILTSQGASVLVPANGCAGNNLTFASEQTPIADSSFATNYYLDDHLGTTQMELSSGGWPIWQGQFTPFGSELPDGSTAMHYKFTGKERDVESGLDDFGARYYGSSMGRFMSPDPSGLLAQRPADPQSWNLYAYARNNPLINIDPTGLDCVYANDAGNGVESIDHNSSSGECGGSGGSWVPGYADENWAHYNATSGMFQVGSINGGGAGATVDYTMFGAGDNTGFNASDTACSGCAGFASANANWLQGQLVGNNISNGLDGYIQFLTGREQPVNAFDKVAWGPIDPSQNNWAGRGGMGPPGGSGDWRASMHDYNFYENGPPERVGTPSQGIHLTDYFNPTLSPAVSKALIQSNEHLMNTGGVEGLKEKFFFGIVNAFQFYANSWK